MVRRRAGRCRRIGAGFPTGVSSVVWVWAARRRAKYQSPGASNVVWASVQNQFFDRGDSSTGTAWTGGASVDLPPPSSGQNATRGSRPSRSGYQAAPLVQPALERRLEVFAGPKEYNTLAKLGRNVDLVMGFGGFFGWFAKLLLTSMNGLHSLGLSYGATIIAITVIIKILFWPLTQASTRSMKRMQALQPQMKALQKVQVRWEDEPEADGVSQRRTRSARWGLPAAHASDSGVFGFFQMLRSGESSCAGRAFSGPATCRSRTVALVFGFPINPLPLIMGATQIWQMRLTPPSPGQELQLETL